MILILGSHYHEQGTNPVIDWLLYYKANFIKIATHDLFIHNSEIKIDVIRKTIRYNKIDLHKECSVIWYRHFLESFNSVLEDHTPDDRQANKELSSEAHFFTDFFYECLKYKKWVSPFPAINLNKLTLIHEAEKVGLRVPETRILSSQKSALEFLEYLNAHKIIIKQFSDRSRFYYIKNDSVYFSFVKSLGKKHIIEHLEDRFFPTLFQEKIEIEYEVRVFYIDGQFFASAILMSKGYQNDDRKIAMENPDVHVVRYALAPNIKKQVQQLMVNIGLLMGAIDLIKSKDGDYYFLEVNPIGQYLFESDKCNYHIAKHIAEYLIENDN